MMQTLDVNVAQRLHMLPGQMQPLAANQVLPKLQALVEQLCQKMPELLQEQTRFGACDAFASALHNYLTEQHIGCSLVRLERSTYELYEPFECWQDGYDALMKMDAQQRLGCLIDVNNLSHVVVGVQVRQEDGQLEWTYVDAQSTQALDRWWDQWTDERQCISIFEPISTSLLEIKALRKAKNEPFDLHVKQRCAALLRHCSLELPPSELMGKKRPSI